MKKMRKRTIAILLSMIIVTAGLNAFAQRGHGMRQHGSGYGQGWNNNRADFNRPARGYGQFGMGQGMNENYFCRYLDLTDEQVEKVKELREKHFEEVQSIRGKIRENANDHRDLMISDKLDKNAIDANIDEKTELMNKQMKKRVEFRLEFRDILTDEQKEKFDNSRTGFGMHKGMRNDMRKRGRIGRSFHGRGFHRW